MIFCLGIIVIPKLESTF